jgi:hypothetical protein
MENSIINNSLTGFALQYPNSKEADRMQSCRIMQYKYQVMYNKAEMEQPGSDSTVTITSCCPYV